MVAIRHEDDPFVVSKPRQVVDIADGYAAGGMPVVIDWLEDHSRTPLMSLTRNVTQFLDATTSRRWHEAIAVAGRMPSTCAMDGIGASST